MTKPHDYTLGYNQAVTMLRDGSYISPEQCYNDSAHLLLLWSDKSLFITGVEDGFKHVKGE